PGSHESSHAPVASPVCGSKQGTHTFDAPHVDCGSSAACSATAGRHGERQRPSRPATDSHVSGMNNPLVSMNMSGTHSWLASHAASSLWNSAGTRLVGTQWAPPDEQLGQGESALGSMG